LIAVVLYCSIIWTMGIAYTLNHIPYIPCDVSKTANKSPEYYIFSTGLTVTALCLVYVHSVYDKNIITRLLGYMGSISLSGLAIFNTDDYFLIHAFFATACFTCYIFYIIRCYVTPTSQPLLITGSLAYSIRVAMWPIIHSLYIWHWALPIPLFLLQFRAILQYIAIICLTFSVLTFHRPKFLDKSHIG